MTVPRASLVLARLCAATLLSMSVWFSATAVAPSLQSAWNLSASEAAWLTMVVQIGFVAGTLLSALLTLADRIEPQRLFALCSLSAAGVNAALIFVHGLAEALPLRFLTGALQAGVYPPAMKLAASWSRRRRGLAVGALIGALTMGSAAPHLFGLAALLDNARSPAWETTVLGASVLAAAGALLVLGGAEQGPYREPAPAFDASAVLKVLRPRGLRLTNLGYLGHMWELYAMWTWAPTYLRELFEARYGAWGTPMAAGISFCVIAAGGVGSLLAGHWADRFGRTAVVIVSLVVSGACSVFAGRLEHFPSPLIVSLFLVWGFAVVADSAQFSTMVTELAPRRLIGTALTLQTALGFLLTTVSLQALPLLRERLGWSEAFALLALGPVVGIAAMIRLRSSTESAALARGKK